MPNSPVLTATDLADGTGISITTTGSTSGATNLLYYQHVNGNPSAETWTVLAEAFTEFTSFLVPPNFLTPGLGYYWWKVVSTHSGNSNVSNLVYAAVTTSAQSIHERLIQAVKARLLLLTFSGLSSASIVDRMIAVDLKEHRPALPAILIGIVGKESFTSGGTNRRDEVDYPVGVMILAADNVNMQTNRPTYLKWREQIIRSLQNFRPSTVSECNKTYIVTDPIIPVGQWYSGKVVSAVIVHGVCWQTRGLTT